MQTTLLSHFLPTVRVLTLQWGMLALDYRPPHAICSHALMSISLIFNCHLHNVQYAQSTNTAVNGFCDKYYAENVSNAKHMMNSTVVIMQLNYHYLKRLQYMLCVPLKARNSSIIYSHEPVNASRHWIFEFKTRSLTVALCYKVWKLIWLSSPQKNTDKQRVGWLEFDIILCL